MSGRKRLILAPVLAAQLVWLGLWLGDVAGWYRSEAGINVMRGLVAGLAGCAILAGARSCDDRRMRRSFQLLGAASLVWAAGQAVWTYDLELRHMATPYPSLADAAFVASLLLFGGAVAVWPRRATPVAGAGWFELGLTVVAAGLLIFEFALQPVLADGPSGLKGALDLGYPIVGFGFVAVALVGLLFDGWRYRGRFVLVASGLLLLGVVDTAFGQGDGRYSDLLDPLWTAPFVLVAVAASLDVRRPRRRLHVPDWACIGFALIAFVAIRASHIAANLHGEATAGVVEDMVIAVVLSATVVHAVRLTRLRAVEAERLARVKEELERAYLERDAALEASRTGVAFFENRSPRFCNGAFIELIDPLIGGDDWTQFLADVDRSAAGARERTIQRGDRTLWVRATALAGERLLVTVDDVTRHIRERENRDRFVVEVLRARDQEVRRISELLHDDAVQELSALALRLEVAGVRGGRTELARFASETNAITASIRRLLVDLHPPVLESRGLAAAIGSAADPLRAAGIDVEVNDLDIRFAPELELLAYRIAQEALANVLEHAHARHVDVTLTVADRTLECRITDDGVGFDRSVAASALSRGGLGIHVSRERLELVRGSFKIESARGRGTTVTFRLPVAVAAPEGVAA